MRTRVWKWGNSLAVRIPKRLAEEAGLRPSTEVEVSLERGELRVAPVRPQWRLDQLLSKVTKRNLHAEVGLDSDYRLENDPRFLSRTALARASIRGRGGVRLEALENQDSEQKKRPPSRG